MDEFDDGRQLVVSPPAVAVGVGREQQQRGPDPLAAGADDVLGDLVDQSDFRCRRWRITRLTASMSAAIGVRDAVVRWG